MDVAWDDIETTVAAAPYLSVPLPTPPPGDVEWSDVEVAVELAPPLADDEEPAMPAVPFEAAAAPAAPAVAADAAGMELAVRAAPMRQRW